MRIESRVDIRSNTVDAKHQFFDTELTTESVYIRFAFTSLLHQYRGLTAWEHRIILIRFGRGPDRRNTILEEGFYSMVVHFITLLFTIYSLINSSNHWIHAFVSKKSAANFESVFWFGVLISYIRTIDFGIQ